MYKCLFLRWFCDRYPMAIKIDERHHTVWGLVDKLTTCKECCWESRILRYRSLQQPRNILPRGWRTPNPQHWKEKKMVGCNDNKVRWLQTFLTTNIISKSMFEHVSDTSHLSGKTHINTCRSQYPGSEQRAVHSCPAHR